MDYEPHRVEYVAGNAYVGATLSMFPADRVKDDGDGFKDNMGNFIAWDAGTGKIVWSKPELFSVWSGVLTTAGGIAVYGTLDGTRPRRASSATSAPG
jgi:glucose dehydrogenase